MPTTDSAGMRVTRRPSVGKAVPAHLRGRFRRDPLLRVITFGYQAAIWIDSHLRLPDAGASATWTNQRQVRVTRRADASPDGTVVTLDLLPVDGDGVRWSVGAHLDVTLPSGRVRQYSLCGATGETERYQIAVRRVGDDGGSAEVHDTITEGSVLTVSTPRNAFPLAVGGFNQRTSSVRLIAGGIGITPIRPMLAALKAVDMQWSMAYAGRDLESLAFVDDLAEFGERVTLLTDDGNGPPSPQALLGELPLNSAVYVCGPPPMIDAIRDFLITRPDVELHYERFSPAPVIDGHPFELRLARTNETVEVDATETALSALLRARPDSTYSCQQGFCRSCVVRVIDGTPDHRSTGLSQAEKDAGSFLPCVSRADGVLTVDV